MSDFFIPVYLPFSRKTVKLREYTNQHNINIIKFIDAGVTDNINSYIETILAELVDGVDVNTLTNIDKFVLIFTLRDKYISDTVLIEQIIKGRPTTITIYTTDIIKRICELPWHTLTDTINIGNLTLILAPPSKLLFNTVDDLYDPIIYKFIIDGKEILFGSLSDEDKAATISSLPSMVLERIKSFIQTIQQYCDAQEPIFNNIKHFGELKIQLVNGTLFHSILLLLNDNIANPYYIQYHMINKIRTTYDHYMQITPKETDNIIKIYNAEVQERDKQQSHS